MNSYEAALNSSPNPLTNEATIELSEETLLLIDFIFNCCMTQVVSLLAFCGTSINVAVLLSYDLSSDSSAILLLALSLADLIFCLTLPFRRCQCLVTQVMGQAVGMTVGTLTTQAFFIFNRIFFCTSITLIGIIAAERFIAVFWPFDAQHLLTPRRVFFSAFLAYFINIVVNSPGFYLYTHDWVFMEEFNQSVAVLQLSEFYLSNYNVLNFFIMIVYNTLLLGTSMMCTLIFMPLIGVKIWAMMKRRQVLVPNKEVRFDPQLAKVLLIICLVSLVLHGPSIFFDTVAYFIPNFINQTNFYEAYEILVDFTGAMSAFINCIVYMTMSSKFKHRYKKLMNRCLPIGRQDGISKKKANTLNQRHD